MGSESASIERKLDAILAIQLELLLRLTDLGESRHQNVDRVLAAGGLTTTEIAALLGKTPRAVQLRLKD